jgi:hypothetical protein
MIAADAFVGMPTCTPARVACSKRMETMNPTEMQIRATIAAALIVSHAVDVPTIPKNGDWTGDVAAVRLRELTDYVYQVISSPPRR